MILGIGNDTTDIRRIETALKRFGARFEQRIFTAAEQKKARSRAHAPATYAKRFAAKEACAKALGTGLRMGTYWRDMEVINLPSGAPTMQLHGNALARLQSLTPAGMQARIHVTLGDEYPYASANIIIEAIPL
jgi:holo-[acyl-carrier protein] synthase